MSGDKHAWVQGGTLAALKAAEGRASRGVESVWPVPSVDVCTPNVHAAISDRDFRRFQQLVYDEAGIWLSAAKVALLAGRLAKRLRHHSLKSFEQYYALVVESPEERIEMLDALSTNETHFFREPSHFEFLKGSIFPQWIREADAGWRSRRIRVWSAGCSSGQEPYSLAMLLLDHFPNGSGWQIEIVATDLSRRVLEIAKRGVWPAEKTAGIPQQYLKSFMLRGVGEQTGKVKAGPELRALIQFSRANLNEPNYPFYGKFDLLFCRNVLIYFDRKSRQKVVRRLTEYLCPEAYLFVGHAESLHEMGDILTLCAPTVYRSVHAQDFRGSRDY